MSDQLWQVTAPYHCSGLTVAQDGVISDAAPIIGYARNRQFAWFKRYCASKGWKLERVE